MFLFDSVPSCRRSQGLPPGGGGRRPHSAVLLLPHPTLHWRTPWEPSFHLLPVHWPDASECSVALCVWCFWRPTGFPSHSSGVRCVQRPRDADPNLQGRKVQRNGSDGLWPVCPMQSSQSVAALWRWRGQALPPFYVLCRVCHLKICILCTVDVSDIDPLPACDLLLATAGRSGLWSQRSSGQVCVQSLMLLPKPTTVSHSVNKNWPNHGPCVRFTQRFAAQ